MIVLDTNVVSEPIKPEPDQAVLDWLDDQAPESLYLTSITVAELLAGLAVMPAGKRRDKLRKMLTEQVLPLFEGRILSFDAEAAEAFGGVHARAQKAGNPISFADAAIASTASVHGFMLATRNVRDFKGTGVELLNPWSASAG